MSPKLRHNFFPICPPPIKISGYASSQALGERAQPGRGLKLLP